MDVRRIGLLAGIAVITYLLILQWNNDYGQPALPDVASQPSFSSPEFSQSTGTDVSNIRALDNDTPTVESAALNNANDIDIPVVSQQTVDQPSSQSTLIKVETDTLNVGIDPKGGDILYISLPKFPAQIKHPDVPFVLLEDNMKRTYTARSGVVGRDGLDKSKSRPIYQSAKPSYTLNSSDSTLNVDLTLQQDNVNVIKRFTFSRDSYIINVEYIIQNTGSEAWQGNFFAQIKRDASADPTSSSGMGMSTYLGPAFKTNDERYNKVSFGDIDDSPFKESVTDGWVAMSQHYFVSAWVPPAGTYNYTANKNSQRQYLVGFTSPAITAAPGETTSFGASLYAGPKDQEALGELADGLDLTVDYGWLWFIAQPLFALLSLIHSVVLNWGWAIVILTIIIKAAFFSLSSKSYRSMAKMKLVAPKMQQIKERYGDDRQKLSQEMMALYRKEKVNPMSSCLPMLVQMPVFLALYWVLLESVELRHAPFIFWINDLSVKDPYFILPILMGVSMFIQMQLNPQVGDPMQARVMKFMPIVMTFFFLWFPAGLVLYWLVNNIMSLAQQHFIMKSTEKSAKPATT